MVIYSHRSQEGGWHRGLGASMCFGIGVLMTTVLTLFTPLAAQVSVWALVVLRVMEGLLEVNHSPSFFPPYLLPSIFVFHYHCSSTSTNNYYWLQSFNPTFAFSWGLVTLCGSPICSIRVSLSQLLITLWGKWAPPSERSQLAMFSYSSTTSTYSLFSYSSTSSLIRFLNVYILLFYKGKWLAVALFPFHSLLYCASIGLMEAGLQCSIFLVRASLPTGCNRQPV